MPAMLPDAISCLSVVVDDAVRARAASLTETCGRAVVCYYRPDGGLIERADVGELFAVTEADALSIPGVAVRPV